MTHNEGITHSLICYVILSLKENEGHLELKGDRKGHQGDTKAYVTESGQHITYKFKSKQHGKAQHVRKAE